MLTFTSKRFLPIFLPIFLLLSLPVHAGPAVGWGSPYASSYLAGITLKNGASIIAGALDPSAVAVSAAAGSIYMSSAGGAYVKTDSGSSTNWTLFNTGAAAVSTNTANAPVKRDSSGNFSAGTITANLTGNASGSCGTVTGGFSGEVTGTQGAMVAGTSAAEQNLGALTWAGGVDPTGTISKTYRWTRVGKNVTFWAKITATVGGTANSSVSFAIPGDLPAPAIWGTQASSALITLGAGSITAGESNNVSAGGCGLYDDGASSFVFKIFDIAALNAQAAHCQVTYRAN